VTADVVALIEQAIREGIARAEAAREEFEFFIPEHDLVTPHVQAHSPADALRAHHADLELLARVRPNDDGWWIDADGPVYPWLLANLARRYNVPTEETA
jgi:hypothetical protein